MSGIEAVVFDFYGTLVDVAAVARACRRVAPDPDAFIALWRAKQIEYTFLTTAMGAYRTFWDLTGRALDYALCNARLSPSPDQRKRLMNAWLQPVLYPDTVEALARMGPGRRLAILSNGNPRMLSAGLRHVGLPNRFDAVLSADAVRRFKPAPEVYRLATDELGLPADRILFVSSNGFDVVGSKRFGLRVCWVNRRGAVLDPLGPKPDLVVSTLEELADRVSAASG